MDGRNIRCPVCGDGIEGESWHCDRCSAPHHEECARYFGGCAIFGCRDGHPPSRLEVETWPKAAAVLGRFVRLRRIQTWSLLAFFCLSLWLGVFNTSGDLNYSVWLTCSSFVAWFASGGVYLCVDILAGWAWRRLGVELGPGRAQSLELRSERVRSLVPTMQRSWWRFRWLSVVGAAGIAASILLPLLSSANFPYILCFVSVMAIVGAEQLRKHTHQVEFCFHRFEATFAPRLEKGGARKPDPGEKLSLS